MNTAHDVRDRRATGMGHACTALDNMRQDLLAFASNPVIVAGVCYSVADRLERIITELEAFKARDLLNMREAQS